ncbi:DEAD/DEAH box helicase family protein [Sphingomonas sp. Ag1]|uniref:DEAD/DEAH box helicase family protein n=1 Tax=Sphingomonas sp. Ag1 TaxID=1642949 RepID=UPI000AE18534|nr:DEAD/DEAH box helicase family protein [Sphingomonas sp. Ag1]
MSTTFYSVSAPAGSGKTFSLVRHALLLAQNHQKVLIAQPTKLLIDQTERDLLAHNGNVKVTKIVSSTGYASASVNARIVGHMAQATQGQDEILLVSHVALAQLPNAYRQFWNLFVDEVPGAFTAHKLNIRKSHGYITQHITLDADLVPGIPVVSASDVGALRALAQNSSQDDAIAVFKKLADDILNPDKVVCVQYDAYNNLLTGAGKAKEIHFFAFQKSDFVQGYASTTIMGANFDDTELAKIWEKVDSINWKPHPVINGNLRYKHHTNGRRLTIKYVISGNWSQEFGKKSHNGSSVLQSIANLMTDELGEDFLWQSNKKDEDYLFDEGLKLPQNTQGLNRKAFQRTHGVALVKAINHSTGPAAFLKAIGLTDEELKITLQYQNEYQAMMRCSLREPNAKEDVTVCVVSEGSARWLAARFPNCNVEQIKSDIPEPKLRGNPVSERKTPAESMWDSRENKKVRDAAANGEVYVARPWTPREPKGFRIK